MTTPASLPNLFVPRKLPPSQRDREIYRAVRVAEERQEAVARRYQVSQPRVAQIVSEVEAWTEGATAEEPGEQELSRAERLARAEQIVYERLEHVYAEALAAWRKSLEDAEVRKSRQVGEDVVEERIVKPQSGKAALLNQAMRAAIASARLLGVDPSGKEVRKLAQAQVAPATDEQSSPTASATPRETTAAPSSARTTYKAQIPPENAPVPAPPDLGLSEQERMELFEEALRSVA